METKTIGQIVADDFRAAEIFKSAGIDFCCGGNKTIEQATAEKKITLADLISRLDELKFTPVNGAQNFKDWDAEFLCDYIVNTHHKLEYNLLDQLEFYTQKIADVHGIRHPELIEIRDLFVAAKSELLPHFKQEKDILFPAIKNVFRTNAAEDKALIKSEINRMTGEHEAAGGALDKINELSKNYLIPEDACNTYRVTYKLLEQLENDIHIHIHLENNILFPKALKMAD